MVIKGVQLIFNNPQGTYVSGQIVCGYVMVSLDAPKEFRRITVAFKGEARVSWRETGSNNNTQHYRAHEKYFEYSIMVFGLSGHVEELPSGEHGFQFSLILPSNLPSSFEGKYGYIRYTAKAILDCPWRFNREVAATFTVLSHVDLNHDPYNKEPILMENSKYFCCFWCQSGPLTMVVRLPARGYVCGQIIYITAEVDNISNITISHVECELQRLVTYHARNTRHTKNERSTISTLVLEGSVRERDSRTWTKQMAIPPTPCSVINECRIIDLTYKLVVKAQPQEHLHMNLNIKIPIIIGTVPIWRNQEQQQEFASFPSLQPFMVAPSAPFSESQTNFAFLSQ